MSDKTLAGAVALVTDAGSDIGAGTAHRLAREGATVALVARSGDRLDQVADDIRNLGGHAIEMAADITDPERACQAVQDTHDRLGRLDILVNNAGIVLLDTALHAPLDEWDRLVALNVTALLHLTHAAVPYLIDAAATSPRQVADLVNVSLTAGQLTRQGSSVYNLTRSGLEGFTESLRRELLVERVRVGLVEPAVVEPRLVNHFGTTTRTAVRRPAAGRETLRPEDVADAIAYVVTRDRRVAVSEMRVHAAGPS
ncbi:SDR family NAD(P)-dependent oxidoreductase [Amycolatopsis sp. NPDC051128]|uniref:SDR family oxidoreductase n=1 Tax=Amycolatopsis sp. NPDC051128 TaxID=3155412 RepID=UPI003442AE9E